MEQYRAGFDGIRAATPFKARMAEQMLELGRRHGSCGHETEPAFRMPARRKALLIALAAAILLLSACAAYAVYWSSVVRAKEYSQSERAADDRLALVTHGGFAAYLLRTLVCVPEEAAVFFHHDNTGITRVRFRPDGRVSIRFQNRVEHLPPEMIT